MIHHMSIDIETYSSVDLLKCGLYKYVQPPDFDILLFAYSIDSGPVEVLDLTTSEGILTFFEEVFQMLLSPWYIKHAYNAAFEWYCLSEYISRRNNLKAEMEKYGLTTEKWLSDWRCTMLQGLYCGYAAGLDATANALGFSPDKKKKSYGKALIKLFCTPCIPTAKNGYRSRNMPCHEPEKWELFQKYCRQDVVVEMEILKSLSNFPVPDSEERLWQLDQLINLRGVKVDMDMIHYAMEMDESMNNMLMEEARQITGLDNPNSAAQMLEWMKQQGVELENLQKETVSNKLDLIAEPRVKRALEIRQEMSKTSVKKYNAMNEAVCQDGRIRGLLQFYGANRTGRWAGRLVQVHNLPRNYLGTLDLARECLKQGNMDVLKILYGNVPDTLSQLIRTTFVPEEGKKLLVADFSAIEARVIAWLAQESWRLEVFATHGKIYEASASAMFSVPIDKIKKGNPEYDLRQKGKIAELALGYQGSTGALKQMGAINMGLTEEELPDIVKRWRSANRNIVNLWYSIEGAALDTVKTGRRNGCAGIFFNLEFDPANEQVFLTVTLPSKRKLYYVKPHLGQNQWGNESIQYYSVNQTSRKWEITETYGGKLVENIVQAIARDCLAESLKRLDAAGYEIVFHVHDEVVAEGQEENLEQMYAIMGQPIDWAPGLLLKAEGFASNYYKKD